MPANLTPQYHLAEEKYKAAETPEEKAAALKEMLSTIPKHKGTEKLQADIKKRLAVLKKDSQKKSARSTFNPFHVEKQGAGQVVLAGYPNVGKSTLVASLTRAKTKVADYPFSTTVPVAGMMPYEDILIQLVDTPPITPDVIPPGILMTYRGGDALLIIIDVHTGACLDQLEGTLAFLAEKKVISVPGEGRQPRTLPYLVVANKADLPGSLENMEVLRELRPDVDFISLSSLGESLEDLKAKIFDMLDVVRIYSKTPGKPPDMDRPFTLKRGGTVLDFAHAVHRDFPDRLKNALVWGSSRFDGQAVPRDYLLQDRDIVELQV
jgi:uncharacterized protein